MTSKQRFRIRKPSFRLYDTTGISTDVQQGLTLAIVGVTLSMVFSIITMGAAWTSFLRALGADSMTLGVLSAIPVAASTLQIFASYILERFRIRRTLLLVFGIAARIAWIVIGLIPVMIPESAGNARLALVMVLLGISAAAASFLNVSFYSLMGDLVPLRIRGRYFSARHAISLISGILTGLLVSLLMDRVTGMIGYSIILVTAGIFGCLDICCFLFIKWPPMAKAEGPRESFFTMLRAVFKDEAYMKIVVYFTLWLFAVCISAPFANVYFLEHLRMTFTEITIYNQILPNIATVLVIGWWGRKADQYGNQPVVQTVGLYCMLFALMFTFTGPRSFVIMPFAQIMGGLTWPASDLSQQNMYLAKAPVHNRSMYIAVFFASTQLIGTALSNFVGGVLMSGPLRSLERLKLSWFGFEMTRYHFLFLLGTVLRAMCVLGFLPHLRGSDDTPASVMMRETGSGFIRNIRGFVHGIRTKRLRKKLRRGEERLQSVSNKKAK